MTTATPTRPRPRSTNACSFSALFPLLAWVACTPAPSPAAHSFSCWMPGTVVRRVKTLEVGGRQVQATIQLSDLESAAFFVFCYPLPAEDELRGDAHAALEREIERCSPGIPGGEVVSRSSAECASGPMIEILVRRSDGGEVRSRVLYAHERVYNLGVTVVGSHPEWDARVERFFASMIPLP